MAIASKHIEAEEQIQKLKNIIYLIEKEKDEIGYELHENLCQLISASLLYINMAQKNVSDNELAYLEEAIHILKDVLSELRIMAKNISPITLKSLGFVSMIHHLSDLIKVQKEIDCIISIDEKSISTLSLLFQNTLYQIIQLQMINIIRCADVKNVEINLLSSNGKVKMQIQSDGLCENEASNKNNDGFKKLIDTIEGFGGSFDLRFHHEDMRMIMTVYI